MATGTVTQLNNEQVNRYKRHLILPEVGMEGQKKLLNAKVLCIGAGGLGCPISLYLAAAGVGTIGLADVDVVSPSNLQRQVLFGLADVGIDKVKAAAKRLKDLNPDVKVIEHKTIVNSSNVLDLIKDGDSRWEQMVPVEIAETIKRRCFFGYKKGAEAPAAAPERRYDN